jgi:hypothetical protein
MSCGNKGGAAVTSGKLGNKGGAASTSATPRNKGMAIDKANRPDYQAIVALMRAE